VYPPCFSEEFANKGLIFLRVKKSAKEWELDDENKGVRRALF
jgi:hypothetical protein